MSRAAVMRLPGIAAVAALALAAAVGVAEARDPRIEQLKLNGADTALAKRVAVKRSDLVAGWKAMPVSREEPTAVACPGFRPDFSAFTITGHAESEFEHRAGASLSSTVEVYESVADAVGDFRTGSKPGLARCFKLELEKQFAADDSVTARVVSARMVTAPRVGDRSAAFRVVANVETEAGTVKVYFDLLAFQRGRSIAALMFTAGVRPLAGQTELARLVAARMG